MWKYYRGGFVCLALLAPACMIPFETKANWFQKQQNCCKRCRKPQRQCLCVETCAAPVTCAAPAQVCAPVLPTTTMKPVVETRYVQRPVMAQKQVQETHYRTERYTEQVPTVCYENITVDEGCYQQVWVPKMVTKQVAKTVMQTRVASRAVPYTVTKCVNECRTETVPVQQVRYVCETSYTTPDACSAAAPNPYLQGQTPLSLPGGSPFIQMQPAPAAAVPQSNTTERVVPREEHVPQPMPLHDTSSTSRPSHATITGISVESQSPTQPGALRTVPSAANVWRTPRSE